MVSVNIAIITITISIFGILLAVILDYCYFQLKVNKYDQCVSLCTETIFTGVIININLIWVYGCYYIDNLSILIAIIILAVVTVSKDRSYKYSTNKTWSYYNSINAVNDQYNLIKELLYITMREQMYNLSLTFVGTLFIKLFNWINNFSYLARILYNLQQKSYIFIKVSNLENIFKFIINKDLLSVREGVTSLYKTNEIHNKFRRLPWKLNYFYKISFNYEIIFKQLLLLYNFFKTIIIAISLCIIYFIYTVFFFKVQFLKQIAIWFIVGMLFFWLISGFNFFLKRYQFGKFTSQIQRFWKRTNTYFWLIEGFLLLLFFYYFLNSSQEPLYMYDYSSLNQEYLISLYTVFLNIVLLSLIIYFLYFTMVRVNSNSWEQLSLFLIVGSSFIFFSFFIETYQFYYVISIFNERIWFFNEEDNLWSLDVDNPVFRTKTQYFLVCLIAKYWHFLFIFLSWVFFLMKSFEKKKISIVLFGANLQNIIILYFLNLACYLQWFKWVYRRFFDVPYTWFFINIDNKLMYKIVLEVQTILINIFNFNNNLTSLTMFIYKSLTLWSVDSIVIWKFI